MASRGLAWAAATVMLALAGSANGAASHQHFCDCGHPQGRVACGGSTSGVNASSAEERPISAKLRAASHKAAMIATSRTVTPPEHGYAPPQIVEDAASNIRVRLGVLAVLVPCVLALGLLFLGAMNRRG